MALLKLIEKAVLKYAGNITTVVQADSYFGEVTVAGLALSADFDEPSMQQIKMKISKSSEKVPTDMAKTMNSYVVMDITMFHQDNQIQPELPLEIRMDIPTGLLKENLVIYHNHDGEWKIINPTISGGKMIFTASELSVFVAANLKETPKPPKPSNNNSDDSSGPAMTTVPGTWKKDDIGWWYQKTEGGYLASTWAYVNGLWYYFDQQGYMKTGWMIDEKGIWYYLQDDGSMASSKWINWKEKWYYITWNGAMAVNTSTPDGYSVGADGVWIVNDEAGNK